MISSVLEKKIQTLEESAQKAVRFNIELLDLVDIGNEDSQAKEFLKFFTYNFVLVDYIPPEKNEEDPSYKAFVNTFEDIDYFKAHTQDLFKCVIEKFSKESVRLKYKVQLVEEYRDVVPVIRSILAAYVTRKQSDLIAETAKKQLEEESSVGLENILKKKPHYAQNNLLTRSAFSDNLTVVQKKLLNYFIFKFQHECHEDLFGDSFFTVTTQELVSCGCGSNTTAIVKSLKDLMENTSIHIQYNDRWSIYNMFSSFQGANDHSEIIVRFTPEMSALINKVGVSRNYTLMSLTCINSIKRYSTMRMYELCSQYRNADSPVIYIDDDDLRSILNCKDKYPNPADFKKRVLKDAEKELKDLAEKGIVDMYFECKEVAKESNDWQYRYKKVLKWAFFIHRSSSFDPDAYMVQEGSKKKMQTAYKVVENMVYTTLCDELTPNEAKEYVDFLKNLSVNDISALVQDLQIEVYFSGNKDKVSSLEVVFRKYGFREKLKN